MTSKYPTVVSFYSGDKYYYDCAAKLIKDCESLGLEHDIVELKLDADFDWSQICRQKIAFYKQKMSEHNGPILWVDVDCRILKPLDSLANCPFDLAGFGARFGYIRDYDRFAAARFWIPGILFFNNTPKIHQFLDLMTEIERESTERVTDDYVLQEAWTRYDDQLSVGFLPPNIVARDQAQVNEKTVFVYNSSGQVATYKNTVVQHERPAIDPKLRAQVLLQSANTAFAANDLTAAAVFLRAAHEVSPDDRGTLSQYMRALRKLGFGEEADSLVDQHVERRPDDLGLLESALKTRMKEGEFDLVESRLRELVTGGSLRHSDFARSLLADLARERGAEDAGHGSNRRVKLWWMKTPYPGNFGDVLSPYIVERVSGAPPVYAPRGTGMLAIGSVIKFAREGTFVWGSGSPRQSDQLSPVAQYYAVRGPLTRAQVLQSGGSCPEVYGDPGLLLPSYYRPKPTSKKYRVGLVRHLHHRGSGQVDASVKDISIVRCGDGEIEQFVDELLECETILSTSLHGIITANAYGIPARWCTFTDEFTPIPGDGTKYSDYFLSVGLPEQTCLDLSAFPVIDDSLRKHVDGEPDLKFSPEALIAAFPRPDEKQSPQFRLYAIAAGSDDPQRRIVFLPGGTAFVPGAASDLLARAEIIGQSLAEPSLPLKVELEHLPGRASLWLHEVAPPAGSCAVLRIKLDPGEAKGRNLLFLSRSGHYRPRYPGYMVYEVLLNGDVVLSEDLFNWYGLNRIALYGIDSPAGAQLEIRIRAVKKCEEWTWSKHAKLEIYQLVLLPDPYKGPPMVTASSPASVVPKKYRCGRKPPYAPLRAVYRRARKVAKSLVRITGLRPARAR